MAGNPGNRPQILVDIIANTQQFFSDLNFNLTKALNQVMGFGTQVQATLTHAFDPGLLLEFENAQNKLGINLTVNQQQFASLTEDLDNFKAHSEIAAQGGAVVAGTLLQMQNAAVQYGVSLREAGQILIANGDSEINSINKVLLDQGQEVLSVRELRDAIDELSIKYNNLAATMGLIPPVENEVSTGAGAAAAETTALGDAMEFLGNRIKTVVASLLIVQTIYAAIQGIKDLITASEELAQTQYQLGANIDYANLQSQTNIGTMADWEVEIQKLSDKLGVFSQEDITKAISKNIEFSAQMGLTSDQMGQLVTVAASLAERSGKDLTSTLTELTNAIGGGRLQGLHDIGLYIRNADLATTAWNMGLGDSVNNLSDQQRALVALNTILNETGNLTKTTAGYQDSLAGQLKSTEAQITDTTNQMATDMTALDLFIKSIYLQFLEWIKGIMPEFQPLLDLIEKANKNRGIMNTAGAATPGGKIPTLEDFGLGGGIPTSLSDLGNMAAFKALDDEIATGQFTKFFQEAPRLLNVNSDAYVKLTQAVKDYADALANQIAVSDQESNAFGKRGLQVPNSVSNIPDLSGDLSLAEIKAKEDTQKKLDALDKQYKDETAKNQADYIAKTIKSYDDENKAKLDALIKYDDAIQKDKQQLQYQDIDETTRYNRQLADLATSESQKISDVQTETQKKLVDEKAKYYDALRLLDDEYYFSIFDAAANNDAIALYKAEQKYALDKEKLTDSYNQKNQTIAQDQTNQIQKIQTDTQRQKDLLTERYNQQLADYKLAEQRKEDEAQKAFNDQIDQINQNYDTQRQTISDKYDQQQQLINDKEATAYSALIAQLQTDLSAHATYFNDLIWGKNGWNQYYQSLAILQGAYAGVNGVPPLPGNLPPIQSPPQTCPPGTQWNETYQACMPYEVPGTATTSKNTGLNSPIPTTHHVIISSDGTVNDQTINAVVKQLADAVQTIVVQKGG